MPRTYTPWQYMGAARACFCRSTTEKHGLFCEVETWRDAAGLFQWEVIADRIGTVAEHGAAADMISAQRQAFQALKRHKRARDAARAAPASHAIAAPCGVMTR